MKHTALNIAAVLVCLLARAARADSIFVTMTGVNGSSTVRGHEKAIVATAFSLDTASGATAGTGRPAAAAKTTLSLTLDVDTATPDLFVKAASPMRISEVVVDIVVASPNGQERNVLTIKLSNVEIARMEILTKPGVAAATPIVELTLDADKFEVVTTPEAAANATPADGKFISAK